MRTIKLLILTFFSLAGVVFWITPAASYDTMPAPATHFDTYSIGGSLQSVVTPTVTSSVTQVEEGLISTISAQPTITPTAFTGIAASSVSRQADFLTFEATFEELNIREETLVSPVSLGVEYIKFPDNWLIREGSYVEIDLSHFYSHVDIGEAIPTFAGELRFLVNNQLLLSVPLDESNFEHRLIRLDLPPQLINEDINNEHKIEILLDAEFLCGLVHNESRVVIHPTSVLHLLYEEIPFEPDLGQYPRPFFQQAFEPDQVRFVLPEEVTATETQAALSMAAKLGQLTGDRMVISATTAATWLDQFEADDQVPEHLIVIGQPDQNQLIPLLSQTTDLPIELRAREMEMTISGPGTANAGDQISYSTVVKNSSQTEATNLLVIYTLPVETELIECSPECSEQTKGTVQWTLEVLNPGEATELNITLGLNENVQSAYLENTVILADETTSPINVSTLTTGVSSSQNTTLQPVNSSNRGEYFFVADNVAVPESDGVIQEIVSPWDSQKVILLITGLNKEAVYKASQAMSSGTYFPQMKGPGVLVRAIEPLPPITETVGIDVTFSNLGYDDYVMSGTATQVRNYSFFAPSSWDLTDEAYLRLNFSHSEIIDPESSTLNVLFNGIPIAGIALTEENAKDGLLQVTLPASRLKRGTSNSITVQSQMDMKGKKEACTQEEVRQVWLTIKQDSLLHLDHLEQNDRMLDLKEFPFPYNQSQRLADLLFVFPEKVGISELETALNLASILGSAAGDNAFRPQVALGSELGDDDLSKYHIIALGRPSTNSILQEVNAQLPQPFVPGTDIVEQQVGEVIFRLPPDKSLGYVQQIPSPWNEDLALLAVTGTTDDGVVQVGQVLTNRPLRSLLTGNLALTLDGETVDTFDTRTLTRTGQATAMAVAQATPIAVTATPTPVVKPTESPIPAPITPPENPTEEITGRIAQLPTWVIGIVLGTILVVGIIFGFVFWQTRQRKNAARSF